MGVVGVVGVGVGVVVGVVVGVGVWGLGVWGRFMASDQVFM